MDHHTEAAHATVSESIHRLFVTRQESEVLIEEATARERTR